MVNTSETSPASDDTASEIETNDAQSEGPVNLIKKKDIYDHVTVTTGLRKREVREAVDATFAYLFECLSEGKDVQCPPMGKIRVITKGEGENASVIYKLNLQKTNEEKKENAAAKEALEATPE